jgi:CheY-like chemotaxis protein
MKSASSGPRVLLVEDEMLVAGMLQSMLSSLGYAVAGTTAEVDEAMEILDRETIDAVVLDINLNGQMSYPIADELAARGIPFIFSTGYEQHGLPAAYEGRPLLKKPFRRSVLGDALANLLKQSPERPDRPPPRSAVALEGRGPHDDGASLSRDGRGLQRAFDDFPSCEEESR